MQQLADCRGRALWRPVYAHILLEIRCEASRLRIFLEGLDQRSCSLTTPEGGESAAGSVWKGDDGLERGSVLSERIGSGFSCSSGPTSAASVSAVTVLNIKGDFAFRAPSRRVFTIALDAPIRRSA